MNDSTPRVPAGGASILLDVQLGATLAQALATVLLLAAAIGVLLEKQRTVWVRLFQGLLQHQQRKTYLKRLALQLELSSKIQ